VTEGTSLASEPPGIIIPLASLKALEPGRNAERRLLGLSSGLCLLLAWGRRGGVDLLGSVGCGSLSILPGDEKELLKPGLSFDTGVGGWRSPKSSVLEMDLDCLSY
jgi:hypothetical protein